MEFRLEAAIYRVIRNIILNWDRHDRQAYSEILKVLITYDKCWRLIEKQTKQRMLLLTETDCTPFRKPQKC